jgi:hypothetical protein
MRVQVGILEPFLPKARAQAIEDGRHRVALELATCLVDQEAVCLESAFGLGSATVITDFGPPAARSGQIPFAYSAVGSKYGRGFL